eukprot:gene36848-biopygen30655
MRCDVSDESSVVSMLESVRSMEGWEGGIEGIVHSAGLLRDAMIRGGGAANGALEVWKAKAYSASLLDKHTSSDNLRLFLCFSSITAAVGNVGQSSYGAANAYLEGLMAARRRGGQAGSCIRWPSISGVGMAAATFKDLSSDVSMTAKECQLLLNRVLNMDNAQRVGVLTLLPAQILEDLISLRANISPQYLNIVTRSGDSRRAPSGLKVVGDTRKFPMMGLEDLEQV